MLYIYLLYIVLEQKLIILLDNNKYSTLYITVLTTIQILV